MGTLTAQATGAAGLATRGARWAFLFAWAMGGAKAIIEGKFDPSSPIILSACVLLLTGVILLTHREDLPLHGLRAVAVPVLALAALGLELAVGPDEALLWLLHFPGYLIAALFVRGNTVLGAVGTGLYLVALTGWIFYHGLPAESAFQILMPSLVAFAVGIVWQQVLRGVVRRELAHRSEAAEHARQIRAEREAAERTRRELDLVRSKTEHALIRLRDGAPLDEAFRTELAVIEGGIRDRIRSPRLQHPDLDRAIAMARARGASVTVLAEGSPGSPPLGEREAREVAAILQDTADADSLVIAWTEPGLVSVVARSGDRSERRVVEVDPTGVGPRPAGPDDGA
jgi:hypothetical protein